MVSSPESFWEKLGPAERDSIERIATRRTFAPGDFLCHQGDQTRNVHVVRSGHVRVLATGPDAREVVIAVRTPGDVIGELAALDNSPRSATLQALTPVDVLTVPGARFARLCQAEPRLSWVLLAVIANRLRDADRQWLEFGGGSVLRRVAALLLELAVRHGKPTGVGVEIATPATQDELAATVATSRESLARVLRELRARGLITTGRRRVTIHRMAELERLAR
ncbi:Crp/Fnr family transcriptional regulator [Amycolatopsis anabasis]|uniref:Crp/Fnr family transcriptional regulator n=1 Tax=Amycolatopsis anabasis TaxID=1840409 RepID=UPI00131C8092|nr:Crp/Fnr family transcriptional regulator [Amycolatopsis anabasis]